MNWLKKLSKVIDYIENNLDGIISYEEAAKIACCSPYYFQRIFSYITGISLSEYIRRRRMTKAAFEIQKSNVKIMDIALRYGYKSPTSFNRAFQGIHGVSPTAARMQGTTLNDYPPIRFSISVTGGESMKYRIETKKSFRIVGVRTQLGEDMEQNQKTVPIFWEKMFKNKLLPDICKMADKEPYGILGVTAYINPKNIYYYIAAPTDKPVPHGMTEFEIPSATWVIFECSGRFKESVQTVFRRFLTEWLPASGYEYAELPDIEVYPINTHGAKAGHAQVWISIKKEEE